MNEPKVRFAKHYAPESMTMKRMLLELQAINLQGDYIIPEPPDMHAVTIAVRNCINDTAWQKGMGKYANEVKIEEKPGEITIYTQSLQNGKRRDICSFYKIPK